MRAEIEPEVTSLLERVETYLDRLARRERGLVARAELLEGRLSGGEGGGEDSGGGAMRRDRDAGVEVGRSKGKMAGGGSKGVAGIDMMRGAGGDPRAEERLKALRQKKERLAYAVERLSLQTQQRERQLRKSMAA